MGGLGGRVDSCGKLWTNLSTDEEPLSPGLFLVSAVVSGVARPIAARGTLPLDGDCDVDAEHACDQQGGQLGSELEQGGRASRPGVDVELAEPVGADRPLRLPAGKEPQGLPWSPSTAQPWRMVTRSSTRPASGSGARWALRLGGGGHLGRWPRPSRLPPHRGRRPPCGATRASDARSNTKTGGAGNNGR